jgi:hypothetical protein
VVKRWGMCGMLATAYGVLALLWGLQVGPVVAGEAEGVPDVHKEIKTGKALKETPEQEEEEAKQRRAPAGGVREGKIAMHVVEFYQGSQKKGTMSGPEMEKISSTSVFSPRGPRKAWFVSDVLKAVGFDDSKIKSVTFMNAKGKKITLSWKTIINSRQKVVLSYNFNGELNVLAEKNATEKEIPAGATEEELRDFMHKQRRQSLIFFRKVEKISVETEG